MAEELPVAAIVCIVLACWAVLILVIVGLCQFLKSRGVCKSRECAPCGKEGDPRCSECCINLSESCNCCKPSLDGCLNSVCGQRKLLNEDLYGPDGICTLCCAQEERTQSVCSVWQHWNICCCHCDIKRPPVRRTASFIRSDTLNMPNSVINLSNQLAAQGFQLQLVTSNIGPTSSSMFDSRHQLNSKQESEVIIQSEMIRRLPEDTSRQSRTNQMFGRGLETGLVSTRPFRPLLPAIQSNASTVEDISVMHRGRTRYGSLIPQVHDETLRQYPQTRRLQSIS
ncbi:hypothetical protein CHS0354_025375 [Potamilus streckersoni]|uniref:Uncharacterized protein n=1 Tax=Potamilus streckersoni TaxID=2493646 RepID=A0AAE0SPE9_9BIVA|nr:hypothetical protein CHS0354_025375 [Potamilus streckersoni]